MKSEYNLMDTSDFVGARNSAVSEWLKAFESGSLTLAQFLKHWVFWVPKAFPPKKQVDSYEPVVDKEVLDCVLINTLERFIFSNNEHLQKFFSDNHVHKSVCGHIFKDSEPFYSCRDCCVDSTCVLCVPCFKKSSHINHNYKIGASCGGGCCDCGDIMSWKSDPHCKIHLQGVQNSSNSFSFPEDLISRMKLVVMVVLRYCFDILHVNHSTRTLATILKFNKQLKKSKHDILSKRAEDDHCVVLYNDETHSFGQVANILTNVTKCSSAEAFSIATYVDREGRVILIHASHSRCCDLKQDFDRFTSMSGYVPLNIKIIDWHIMAHQLYSLKILSWIENFMKQTNECRNIFTSIGLNLNNCVTVPPLKRGEIRTSVVEGVLVNETTLWKAARLRWHHLFLSTMLVDHDNKIAFAKVFTSKYKTIIDHFATDDQEHVFSVASLSVQIYTVPAIAHYLIAHVDALTIMLQRVHLDCLKLCGLTGRMEFVPVSSLVIFFRSLCALNDVRYILNVPPMDWTPDLRKNFMRGISMIVEIFWVMQDMCAARRQVGKHLEYEPEWKHEVKMQMKLTPVISHLLNWCSSDLTVTLKAYKLILKKLYYYISDNLRPEIFKSVSLGEHTIKCCYYNVSKQPVSLHLPINRFFAGLYIHVLKFGFSYSSPEFNAFLKPTPLQIIEPVLRAKVMIAQVNAGMWKRNGYSLLHKIYCYETTCKDEMLNKDVLLLQIVASLTGNDEFLIHILSKYNLISWISPDFHTKAAAMETETITHTIILSEELLSLLITIIGERYHPSIGKVTPVECLQYEIIHRLFIKPCPHSELISEVNELNSPIEEIINDVATFQKPNNTQKGVYVAKEEMYCKYNNYYYHYTKEERSVSAELQRKQRKTLCAQDFCPPPLLPSLNVHFQCIACLLHCDVMLRIMSTVLFRSQSSTIDNFSENQLHRVLFLIGFALQEEECYCSVKFTTEADNWNLKFLLEELVGCPHVLPHKDFIQWLLKRYESYTKDTEQNFSDQCSEVVKSGNIENEKPSVPSKFVTERQASIMAKMFALQQNFMKKNAVLFENLQANDTESNIQLGKPEEIEVTDILSNVNYNKTILTCIVCQEDQTLSRENSPMVCAAFTQKSIILEDKMADCVYDVTSLSIGHAVHVNTCGHFMHVKCWKDYIKITYSEKNISRITLSFNAEKNEYLCPLCKSLSNTTLPILPNCNSKVYQTPFSEWIQNTSDTLNDPCSSQSTLSSSSEICESYMLSGSKHKFGGDKITSEIIKSKCFCDKIISDTSIMDKHKKSETVHFSRDVIIVIESFISSLATLKEIAIPAEGSYFLVWHLCAYTICGIQNYLSFIKKPLFEAFNYRQETCLRNLINLSFTLSVLYRDDLIRSMCYQKVLFPLLNTYETDWPDIFQWNCFDVLILLLMSSQSTVGVESSETMLLNYNVFQIVLLLNFAQSISHKDIRSVTVNEQDVTSDGTKCLLEITKLFKECEGINTIELWELLKKSALPFLRCCAILHYFLTGAEPSHLLREFEGDSYENLMDYIGVTHGCQELLGSPVAKHLFVTWASHPSLETKNEIQFPRVMSCKLIDLPHDYFELINTVSTFVCRNSQRDDTKNPTMCLTCGELLCGDAYCCQEEMNQVLVGPCTYHSYLCGAGSGVFLQIRECRVLLLLSNPSRGCFLPAPYIDKYGEPDQGLKRGNPLYFCAEQYNHLQELWLSHGIPEEISKVIESSHGFIPQQWDLL